MAGNLNKKLSKARVLPVSNISKADLINEIPVSKIEEGKMLFSYKHFICECSNEKEFNNRFKSMYHYAKWITLYTKRISEVSTMTLAEVNSSGKSLRFHLVKGENLNKLKTVLRNLGIKLEDVFRQSESNNYYELSLGAANGRIFGYLIDNVFFVLLMDPNHLIYPCLEKGATQDLLHTRYDPWDELQ